MARSAWTINVYALVTEPQSKEDMETLAETIRTTLDVMGIPSAKVEVKRGIPAEVGDDLP